MEFEHAMCLCPCMMKTAYAELGKDGTSRGGRKVFLRELGLIGNNNLYPKVIRYWQPDHMFNCNVVVHDPGYGGVYFRSRIYGSAGCPLVSNTNRSNNEIKK